MTYTGGQFKMQPAAWQGVSLDLGAAPPTGFVERSGALGRLSLKAFDGLSEDPGKPLGQSGPNPVRPMFDARNACSAALRLQRPGRYSAAGSPTNITCTSPAGTRNA